MSHKPKILITAGGTGGHIYPAMGTAEKLLESKPHLEVMFAAGGLEKSAFFNHDKFQWKSISASPLGKSNPLSFLKHSTAILKGIYQSCRLLKAFRPNLVIGFGSYHSFPVLAAAKLLKYPIVLHEQNSKPGKVIRLFSKSSLLTGVYFPDACKALEGKSSLLAMPLRQGFSKNACNREEACRYFGIAHDKVTLLLFGGSQGAQFINSEISKLLTRSAHLKSDFQVLHFAGREADVSKLGNIYQQSGIKAIVKSLEARMDYAWRAADLAVVRAGAGTIAEQIEFEVPAIFIPYPYAADGHQDSNADFVVKGIKGGWKWNEKGWQAKDCFTELQPLLTKNSSERIKKKENLALYKQGKSYSEFTEEILKFL